MQSRQLAVSRTHRPECSAACRRADAKTRRRHRQSDVNSSQSRANQQAAQLRGQENQRDKTLQVAPINGVIAEIPSKVGTFAVAGLSTTALVDDRRYVDRQCRGQGRRDLDRQGRGRTESEDQGRRFRRQRNRWARLRKRHRSLSANRRRAAAFRRTSTFRKPRNFGSLSS